ncbi:MAG: hypothetical protein IT286_00890 [Proteobacteria bacterium]|jgi:hypothetical protein|nr:hypothetical protein [Pseudomonadota bacterium]
MKKRLLKKRKSRAAKIPAIITMDLGKALTQFVEKKTPEERVPKLCLCPLIRA